MLTDHWQLASNNTYVFERCERTSSGATHWNLKTWKQYSQIWPTRTLNFLHLPTLKRESKSGECEIYGTCVRSTWELVYCRNLWEYSNWRITWNLQICKNMGEPGEHVIILQVDIQRKWAEDWTLMTSKSGKEWNIITHLQEYQSCEQDMETLS